VPWRVDIAAAWRQRRCGSFRGGMLCLLWLLFVAKLSWYEAFVGMGALALAIIGFRLVSIRSAVTFNPKMGWFLHICQSYTE
jgi:hypothetical protein